MLITEDGLPFVQRFLRGGAHFFWRFLRLMILGGVIMIMSLAATADRHQLPGRPAQPIELAAGRVRGARDRRARHRPRRDVFPAVVRLRADPAGVERPWRRLRAWLSSLALVARHPVRTYGLAFVFGVLFVAAAAGYLLAVARLGSHTMSLILAGIALQQVFVLVRAALRVGLLAGEMELYQWLRPAAYRSGRATPDLPAPAADARIDLTLAQ